MDFIWMPPVSLLMSFSCSGVPSRIPHCTYSSCCLSPLWALTAPQPFLICHDLDTLKCINKMFHRISQFGFCLMFSHHETEVVDSGREDHRAEVPFSRHHVTGHTVTTLIMTNEVILDHMASHVC